MKHASARPTRPPAPTSTMPRLRWHDLPNSVRDAVQARAGRVMRAEPASAGLNSSVATLLYTATDRVFVKGMRSDHRRAWTQQSEVEINPYVVRVAPRLLWHVDIDGWNILGFEHIPGRPADFSPGSCDLPDVADALRLLAQIRCPDIPMKRLEQRWAGFAEPAALELLRGDSLLHTDLSPDNILISDTAHIVDWAWPTRGAGWVDVAFLVPRLIDGGHTPKEAEVWAQQFSTWNEASHEAIDTFTLASSRMWAQIAHDDPQPWKQKMAAVTAEWREYRSGTIPA